MAGSLGVSDVRLCLCLCLCLCLLTSMCVCLDRPKHDADAQLLIEVHFGASGAGKSYSAPQDPGCFRFSGGTDSSSSHVV